jgi:hypothetical protein
VVVKEGLIGFFVALAGFGAIFAAVWAWMNRLERRAIGYRHAR